MEYKGSVTVFFAVSTMMIISLIFALVEVVHFTGVKRTTDTVSKIGIESAFAQYNRYLWDEYGILAVDAGYGKGVLDISRFETGIGDYLMDNINPQKKGANFLRAMPNEIKLSEYGLLTDNGGAPFIKEASKQGILGMTQEFLDKWTGVFGPEDVGISSESNVDELLQNSKSGMDEAQSSLETGASEGADIDTAVPPPIPVEENPIDTAMSWKSKAVLAQVIRDINSVSTKSFPSNDRPSLRSLNVGNAQLPESVGVSDRLLSGLYLKSYFGNYIKSKDHTGLRYEWEYVLNGKQSDDKNLESTVSKLIGFREVQNMASILADPLKVSEALGLATAFCFLVPFLIEPVKWGIMAAWAYLESVLDVRLLLQGGKVALIKNPAEWTSNIFTFPSYVDPSVTAINAGHGFGYEDYLLLLTLMLSERNLGLRSLDVIEYSLNTQPGYEGCKVDDFIYCGKVDFKYMSDPVFTLALPMLAGKLDTYEFKKQESLTYL